MFRSTLKTSLSLAATSIGEFKRKLNGIEDFVRITKGHVIVARDLNARTVDWGMQTTDTRGRRIVQMMARGAPVYGTRKN